MTADEFTIQELMLDASDGHKLYVHDWGNKSATKAIIFLHGGPGAAINDNLKHFYDPKVQRVIFFDQRGAGKSTPTAELKNNTTDDLIDDISKIADNFKLDKFILHGRSWGSCLALVYAIRNPSRVESILTGGIFLGTKQELDFDERGDRYQTFFPEVWQEFLGNTPKDQHQAPITYHMKQVLDYDPEAAKKSAYVYSLLILGVIKLDDRRRPMDYETYDYNDVKIEAHYKLNNCFLENDYIMQNAHKITMPVYIIQGRYDVMCVPEIAYKLHSALPNSHLSWVAAGHSGSDRAVYDLTKLALSELTANGV